jgi:hypothetical protein
VGKMKTQMLVVKELNEGDKAIAALYLRKIGV